MNEPKTYTANDIERYHKGAMTPSEMHQLEKAALDDPMLADALEGYTFTNTASTDLQTMQNRLQTRIGNKEDKKVVWLYTEWWKVAAVVLLVAGGGWLVFQTFPATQNKLAKKDQSQPTTAPRNKEIRETESGAALVHVPAADSINLENEVAKNEPRKRANVVYTAPAQSQKINAPSASAAAPTANGYTAEAIAVPHPEARRMDTAATANAALNKTATAAIAKKDSVVHMDVVMKADERSLSEVVVTSLGKKAKAKRSSGVAVTLEPEGGWRAFENYIAENVNLPEEIRSIPLNKREVELQFDVDSDGNPVNVSVSISVCKECDLEAIRLLKEGPKWKGKKGRVKIPLPF